MVISLVIGHCVDYGGSIVSYYSLCGSSMAIHLVINHVIRLWCYNTGFSDKSRPQSAEIVLQ